jgi:pimeloyl-ACP methyl ester carboxylesterase
MNSTKQKKNYQIQKFKLLEKQEGYIKVENVNIYFEFINKHLLSEHRPLLVFLHEGLGSIRQWKDFPGLLCEKTNCPALLYDREGHGRSDELKNQRGNDFMHIQAQKVLPEIFKQLGIENQNKILIGHSDGGSIAIINAGTFPKNIIGIITEASHQFIEKVTSDGLRETVKLFNNGRLRELLYKYHGEKTDSMFHGWADTWLRKEFEQWNIEEYLKNISCPFMAIQGEDDQYGTFAQLESIQNNVEKAVINNVLNCGHIPHQQAKEIVLNLMTNFINDLCKTNLKI